ncbi:ribonuclease E activity regulator RraA [uncultured Ilyobacter sp.]|uniref:ribonuclease E activity regulator RraA n=1 Tax=uncultured Ilyobacter sp. TaxID=544433 RepID=UPI0029C62A5F|nr:ribonuclease E activity regulator RraA [uncultured Ilyobacter sp.]
MSEKLISHGTAEVCDLYWKDIQVFQPMLFKSYGGKIRCSGEVVTVSLDEDNSTLKTLLQSPGNGRIAVAKVKGNFCAVVGDNLCKFAIDNGWGGIIIEGFVRDTHMLKTMPMVVLALGTYPLRSSKKSEGTVGETLDIAGVKVAHTSYIYIDEDGIVLSKEKFSDINFVK